MPDRPVRATSVFRQTCYRLAAVLVLAAAALAAALLLNPLGVRAIRNFESVNLREASGPASPCSGQIEVRLLGSITLDSAEVVEFGVQQDNAVSVTALGARNYPAAGTFDVDLGTFAIRPPQGRTTGFIQLSADVVMDDAPPATIQLSWRCQRL